MTPPPRLPYPGLRAFRREESDLFFGRDACVAAMVDRLGATRFLAVLGASGSGKSSLVRTGLLDALDLGLCAQAGSDWRVVDFAPGGEPMRRLARRTLQVLGGGEPGASDIELFRALLRRGPKSLAQWLAARAPERNLLLLVDQFEELFRFADYAGKEESEAFVALLIESAASPDARIHVALTMRSEFLGACSLIDGLAETIVAGLYLIPRMRRDQCREAIVGPAANCGFEIEDALVTRLLNDIAALAPWDEARDGDRLEALQRRADQLPLLQYVLNRMYVSAFDAGPDVRLTLQDYRRVGGLKGAIDAQGEAVLATLPNAGRTIERTFRALTERTARDAVRRPLRYGDLIAICDGDRAAVRAVVDAFRAPGVHFLTPAADATRPAALSDEDVVDISHESLIRHWRRFPAWLDAEARAARLWRRLREKSEDREALTSAELRNLRAWLDSERPNAAWARRYGGDFQALTAFVADGDRRRARWAALVTPLIGLSSMLLVMLQIVTAWQTFAPNLPTPEDLVMAFIAIPAAATWAASLVIYRDASLRRAIGLGAVILGVLAAGALIFIVAYARAGQTPLDMVNAWLTAFVMPASVAVAAIFDPHFRDLRRQLALVSFWSVAWLTTILSVHNNFTLLASFLGSWTLWCALFGWVLRPSKSLSLTGGPIVAAAELGLIGLASAFQFAVWHRASIGMLFGDELPIWLAWTSNIAGFAAVSVALAYGLERYRRPRKSGWVVGAIKIFAIAFVVYTAGEYALMFSGLDYVAASRVASVALAAPCVLAGLAWVDGRFRDWRLWLPISAAFMIPAAGIVGLLMMGTIGPVSEVLLTFALLSLWIGLFGAVFRSRAR